MRTTRHIWAALLMTLLLGAVTPAAATPIETGEAATAVFHGNTCVFCAPWSRPPQPDVTLEGTMTVVPAIGTYFQQYWKYLFQGEELLVTQVSGTLTIDCHGIVGCQDDGVHALSLAPAPYGDEEPRVVKDPDPCAGVDGQDEIIRIAVDRGRLRSAFRSPRRSGSC